MKVGLIICLLSDEDTRQAGMVGKVAANAVSLMTTFAQPQFFCPSPRDLRRYPSKNLA